MARKARDEEQQKGTETVSPPIERARGDAIMHLFAAAIIVGLGSLVYSQTLEYPFAYDDIPQIIQNSEVRLNALSWQGLRAAAMDSPVKGRPLAYITFALNYWWGKYDVVGYHATNIAIHVINGLLVYVIATLMLRQYVASEKTPPKWLDVGTRQGISLVTSLIFTVHPIQIQSVTYIVQRMNSLAVLFYLAAFALYLIGRGTDRSVVRWSLWTIAFGSWGLSLLTKQITVTLPVVVFLYEWFIYRRLSKRWLRIASFISLAIALVVAAVIAVQLIWIGGVFNAYRGRDFTMLERLMTQPRVVMTYTGLVFLPLPSRFNLLHEVSTSHSLIDPPTTILSILALSVYLWVAVWVAPRQRLVSFLLFWPIINLLVESTILPIEMIYEHRMYLPMVGIAMLASMFLFWAFSGRRIAWRMPVLVALIIGLSASTFVRNLVWRDPVVLWTDIIEKSPGSARAFVNRAGAYDIRGEWQKAMADYKHAYALDPTDDIAIFGHGLVLRRSGKTREAIPVFTEAANKTHNNNFRSVVYRNRGAAWSELGDNEKALEDYNLSLKWNPDDYESVFNRGNANRRMGRDQQAASDYEECIRMNPDYSHAYKNLALLLLTTTNKDLRDVPRAIELAKRACDITKNQDWSMLESLAEAYAANNQYEQAAQAQEEAVEMAPRDQQLSLKRRAEIYRSHLNRPGAR